MRYTLKSIILFPLNLLYYVKPELALRILFFIKNKYPLDLKNPTTFNEKLQWIKLYYRNQNMTRCVDKFLVRDYVKECGCAHLLNDILWEGFNPDDIPFDELPEKFVIKVTHGSGFNIICRDKKQLNITLVKKQLKKWLKVKFLPAYGEWFYGVEKPRIIIEVYLDDHRNIVPIDYKVLCFHGEPKYILVDTDRFTNHKRNVYDTEWNFIEDITLNFPNDEPIEKPKLLQEMLLEAKKLSRDFIHARVDFYIINNRLYFGEITFTNGAGFDRILPYSFDKELGSYIHLPNKSEVHHE